MESLKFLINSGITCVSRVDNNGVNYFATREPSEDRMVQSSYACIEYLIMQLIFRISVECRAKSAAPDDTS